MIAPGDKVYLRACQVGQPGTVIRTERGKLTVYWGDMDFWSRHKPDSLIAAIEPPTYGEQQR
jgi:hypothetical protein